MCVCVCVCVCLCVCAYVHVCVARRGGLFSRARPGPSVHTGDRSLNLGSNIETSPGPVSKRIIRDNELITPYESNTFHPNPPNFI